MNKSQLYLMKKILSNGGVDRKPATHNYPIISTDKIILHSVSSEICDFKKEGIGKDFSKSG